MESDGPGTGTTVCFPLPPRGALDYIVKTPEASADVPRIVERALREWQAIEERRAAERAPRERKKRHRALFGCASDSIAVARLDSGVLLDCNAAPCDLVGRTREEMVGQRQTILHPRD